MPGGRTCALTVVGTRFKTSSEVSSRHGVDKKKKTQCNWWCAARGSRAESWSHRRARTAVKRRSSERTLRHREYATTWSVHSSSWRISREVTVRWDCWLRPPRTKQVEDDGRAARVHHGGQPRGGKHVPTCWSRWCVKERMRTFVDTTIVGVAWGLRSWDEDWHAICHPQRRRGTGVGETCPSSMWSCTRRSTLKKPGVNEKARALRSTRDRKAHGEAGYDQKS